MRSITKGWATVAAVAVLIPAALATAAIAPAQPVARAARACNLGSKVFSLGPTYVESPIVSGTSCATLAKVIKAYNRCRLNAGGVKGHCNSRVLGFRCRERRSTGSSIQFVAKVRCTKRHAGVRFSYTQDI